MSWNYRVIRIPNGKPGMPGWNAEQPYSFAVHEVHYDDDGAPIGHTVNASDVSSDTVDGMRWALSAMRRGLKKPVLEDVDGKLVEVR